MYLYMLYSVAVCAFDQLTRNNRCKGGVFSTEPWNEFCQLSVTLAFVSVDKDIRRF